MKTIKLHLVFFGGLLLTSVSCKNYESNVNDTQAQIFNTEYDLRETQTDIQADYEAFKMKMNEIVMENESKLSDLKTKAASKNKEQKLKIAKRIAKLEVKNNNLKTKLMNYTEYDSATWESFKKEVETASSELRKEIDEVNVNAE